MFPVFLKKCKFVKNEQNILNYLFFLITSLARAV